MADAHPARGENGVERDAEFFECLDVGLAEIELEGRLMRVNPALCKITGLSVEEMLGASFRDLAWEADQGLFDNHWAKLLESPDRSLGFEFRCLRKGGDIVWLQTAANVVLDRNGRPAKVAAVIQDVAVRKQSESEGRNRLEELERQARLFEGVSFTTPDFLYVFDLEGRFIYANRRLLQVWGLSLQEVVGRTCLQLGYEQWHHDMHMREIAQVIATKQAIKGEVPFRAALTGVFGVYEYVFAPVIDANGEVESIAGSTRDITARKKGEEELRRSHDTFNHLIQNNPFGIYVVDSDFRLRQVSVGAQKVFSSVRPLLSRDFAEVLRIVWTEPFASAAIARFRHTLETGEPFTALSTVEHRQDIGEQEAYDWRIERLTLPDGRFGVVCYFYDLSERQRWEAALRLSEERFQLVAHATNDAIWDWDIASRSIWWNEGVQTLFGFPASEITSNPDWWIQHLHPDDRRSVVAGLQDFIAGEGSIWRAEYRFQRFDGSYADVLDRGHVTRDLEGKAVRMLGAIQDLSDRKRAEKALANAQEELRKHAGTLELLVAERTSKLRETIHELEALSYSISHDMRAPLRAMQGFSQALWEDYREKLDADGVSYLQRISAAATRLDSLIQDILLYTSVGRERLTLAPVALEPLIRDVLMTYHPGQEKNVCIVSPFPPILGHEAFLSQIFSNLLTNALKFVAKGEAPEVRVRCEPGTDFVTVWVEDKGIGIAPQHLPFIFQVFGRVYSEQEYPGTGIGLAIVRRAVQRLGGEAGVEAEVGKGSRFWIRFQKAPVGEI